MKISVICLLLGAALSLNGCSAEAPFIGEHRFYLAESFHIPEGVYNELAPCEVSIFNGSGQLEGEITFTRLQTPTLLGMLNRPARSTVPLKNLRIHQGRLYFTLEVSSFLFFRTTGRGFLEKRSRMCLGMPLELLDPSPYWQANPFYLAQEGDFLLFQAAEDPSELHWGRRVMLQGYRDSLQTVLQHSDNPSQRQSLQRRIDKIEQMLRDNLPSPLTAARVLHSGQ